MVLAQAWPQVAVVGGGAVGCYYGGLLARAGAPVTLIGRAQHVDAISRDGLDFEALTFREQVSMQASTDMAAARGAGLVLFCVKSTDTDAAARELAAHLDASAWVVGLQNGVCRLCHGRARPPETYRARRSGDWCSGRRGRKCGALFGCRHFGGWPAANCQLV